MLQLLWHDFLLSVSSKNQHNVFSSMDSSGGGLQPSRQGRLLNVKIPEGYVQDLAKCIVEILSDISFLKLDLLLQLCSTFQQTCLEALVKLWVNSAEHDYISSLSTTFGSILPKDRKHATRSPDVYPQPLIACSASSAKVKLTKGFPVVSSSLFDARGL